MYGAGVDGARGLWFAWKQDENGVVPRASVHLAAELAFLPAVLLSGHLLGLRRELLPLTLAYLAGSLFLSPDLDLPQSRPARRWGFLRFLWWPYSRVFRHRGLSHHPLLGPLFRFLYLGGVLILVGLLLRGLGLSLPRFPLSWLLPTVVGLWLPQLLHVLVDRLRLVRRRG
ncbi:DUF2227 family putative metal-binding protein [Candidatus Bipolaricaulota bacterium]|nr:DUF2227 family putative metal-binding protein [Candidatus Bipolaricaulota bacterium]